MYVVNNERNESCKFGYDKTLSVATMTYNGGNGAADNSLSTYKVVRVGDIAFEGHTNKEHAYGRFVLNDAGDGLMSPRFSCLRPIVEQRYSFWKHYIPRESMMRPVLVNATKSGTMMNELVPADLMRESILVPVLYEQEAIGRFFKQLDSLITLHQRERRKAPFSWSFAWEQRKLGDFGSVAMCKRIYKEQTSEQGDIPFFKIGTFGADPDAFISNELFEDFRHTYPYPAPGTLLISAAGSIGRVVEYQGEKAYFQDSNIVWLEHDHRLNDAFLKPLYSQIEWGLEGSTIKRLYNKDLVSAEVTIPDDREQKVIGQFFAKLDNLITLHQ